MKYYKNVDLFISVTVLAIAFGHVDCKRCTYTYESGYVQPFSCGTYEYCCGTSCCRSRAISFYQIWYFWLMIILMLLLCSGGGWWYRFRYRSQFQNQQSHLAFPSTTIPASVRPHVYGARPFQPSHSTQGPPPPYPVQNLNINLPQPSAYTPSTAVPQTQAATAPPPLYTGPPPSYAAATAKPPSSP